MRTIEGMLHHLSEEVEGAEEYAEKSIKCKARGNMNRSNKYREMAYEELNHAETLREFYLADVADIKKVYTMTDEEEHLWEHGLKRNSERIAMIKMMLV
jgi:hypothetical protein